MPQDAGPEHGTSRSKQHAEQRSPQTGVGHELSQSPTSGEPLYPAALLSGPSAQASQASYNQPVRSAVMRQMQQTYGNRAVQRMLSGAELRPSGERAVQRWRASRQSTLPVQPARTLPVQPAREIRAEAEPASSPAEVTVQRKEIKSGDSVVGEYDGLNGLESSYQSSWEGEKKSVGVSYKMSNARKPGPVAMPNAVAHAHVTGNGKNIAGVSVKEGPGGGAAQWVSPAALSPATANQIVSDMKAQTPTPFEVTNIRKVSMVTGVWNAPHRSVPTTKVVETVYIALPGGFVEEKALSADLIYSIANGKYLQTDMYASKKEAEDAALLMPEPTPPPKATATPPVKATEPEEDEEEAEETGADSEKLAQKRAKNAEKRKRQRERQKLAKQGVTETQTGGATPAPQTTATPSEQPPQQQAPSAETSWLWSYLSTAVSYFWTTQK